MTGISFIGLIRIFLSWSSQVFRIDGGLNYPFLWRLVLSTKPLLLNLSSFVPSTPPPKKKPFSPHRKFKELIKNLVIWKAVTLSSSSFSTLAFPQKKKKKIKPGFFFCHDYYGNPIVTDTGPDNLNWKAYQLAKHINLKANKLYFLVKISF